MDILTMSDRAIERTIFRLEADVKRPKSAVAARDRDIVYLTEDILSISQAPTKAGKFIFSFVRDLSNHGIDLLVGDQERAVNATVLAALSDRVAYAAQQSIDLAMDEVEIKKFIAASKERYIIAKKTKEARAKACAAGKIKQAAAARAAKRARQRGERRSAADDTVSFSSSSSSSLPQLFPATPCEAPQP